MKLKLAKLSKWAVVGANKNPEKYGNQIYKMLKEKGYEVYPVNPKHDFIDGDKCYNSISNLPIVPEVISIVVPPNISKEIVEQANELEIKNIWFQPGTFDEEIQNRVKELNITAIYTCVLVGLKLYKKA